MTTVSRGAQPGSAQATSATEIAASFARPKRARVHSVVLSMAWRRSGFFLTDANIASALSEAALHEKMRSDFMTGASMAHPDRFLLAGVMGWPVMHSRSPMMHNYWFKKHGLAGSYVPLAIRPEGLAAALRALHPLGFAGCNL